MMHKLTKKMLSLLALGLILSAHVASAKEKILFIPIDDRPVSLHYTVDTLKAAGWDVVTPPAEYIASFNRQGNPDKMFAWLEENALLATDAVVSTDSLIYGGLVPSRTHHLEPQVLAARVKRLLDFKKKFDCLRLYAYDTVMRSPHASSAPAEPAYYKQWGVKIFRMGELKDKKEMGVITKKEAKELSELLATIPQNIQTDLYTRRKQNVEVTKALLEGVRANAFDYFLLGKDDTAVHSDAHRDARQIESIMADLPEYKIRFFVGADQLGLILLNRAVNKIQGTTPLVYPFYQEGKGEQTIPSYEDTTVKNTLRQHILAAGAFPVTTTKRADLVLALNTPVNGITPSATSPLNSGVLKPSHERFLNKIKGFVEEGKTVGVGDIAYGNGSDDALVKGLFAEKFQPSIKRTSPVKNVPLAWELASYAGWNTCSNTLGYALGQGLLRPYLSTDAKDRLLATRYLDEWAYQSHVRQDVRNKLIYPKHWTDGALKPEERVEAEQAVDSGLHKFIAPYFDVEQYGKVKFTLPWSRMFEVDVAYTSK